MTWKEELKELEQSKQWPLAIAVMQQVIAEHPKDVDAYLFMNYLLVNLLTNEDYDENKQDQYTHLLHDYVEESSAKFARNAEYQFYTGITAAMSDTYVGIE